MLVGVATQEPARENTDTLKATHVASPSVTFPLTQVSSESDSDASHGHNLEIDPHESSLICPVMSGGGKGGGEGGGGWVGGGGGQGWGVGVEGFRRESLARGSVSGWMTVDPPIVTGR